MASVATVRYGICRECGMRFVKTGHCHFYCAPCADYRNRLSKQMHAARRRELAHNGRPARVGLWKYGVPSEQIAYLAHAEILDTLRRARTKDADN